jgi:superfamily I DNA/RNA helicase
VIRLSTLHSSKGIEFPVVLLFLPNLGFQGSYDERAAETMQRNLLYVALTRAMDLVVLFTMDKLKEAVLADLAEAIEAALGAQSS